MSQLAPWEGMMKRKFGDMLINRKSLEVNTRERAGEEARGIKARGPFVTWAQEVL